MYYSGSCCCKISPRKKVPRRPRASAAVPGRVCVVLCSQPAWAVVVIQWFVTPYFFPSLSSPSFYALLFTATVLVSNKKKKKLVALFGDSSYYVVMRGLHYKIPPYFYCSYPLLRRPSSPGLWKWWKFNPSLRFQPLYTPNARSSLQGISKFTILHVCMYSPV